MLPFNQVVFAGVLITTYFTSLGLSRKNIKWLQTRLSFNLENKLHVLHVIYCMITGTAIFGVNDMISTFVCTIAMWLIQRFVKRRTVSIGLTWIGMFSWLCWMHVTRAQVWEMHISGCVMLMTIRFTSYAADHNEHSPHLIEWLGWTYFIPGFFTGPTTSLDEYRQWHHHVTKDDIVEVPTPGLISLPNTENIDIQSCRESTEAFIRALWYVPFVIIGQMTFPAIGTTQFTPSQGMLYRVFYAWMTLFCIRSRYYLAWGVAEAAFSACGASEFVWHRGRNVDVWKVETAQSMHSVLKYWNMCTADWLKRYVYMPSVAFLNAHDQHAYYAIIITNIVSAMWHGIAPGYYATFIAAGISTAVGRLMHKHIHLDTSDYSLVRSLYRVIMFIWTNILIITFGLPFQLMTWEATWEVWKGLFFIGHVWLGLTLLSVLSVITLSNKEKNQ